MKTPLPSECLIYHYVMMGLAYIKLPVGCRTEINQSLLQAVPSGNGAILEVLTRLDQYSDIDAFEVRSVGGGVVLEINIKHHDQSFSIVYDNVNSVFPYTTADLLSFIQKRGAYAN